MGRLLLVFSMLEPWNATEYHTIYRTVPTAKNYMIQNVTSAEVENLAVGQKGFNRELYGGR